MPPKLASPQLINCSRVVERQLRDYLGVGVESTECCHIGGHLERPQNPTWTSPYFERNPRASTIDQITQLQSAPSTTIQTNVLAPCDTTIDNAMGIMDGSR